MVQITKWDSGLYTMTASYANDMDRVLMATHLRKNRVATATVPINKESFSCKCNPRETAAESKPIGNRVDLRDEANTKKANVVHGAFVHSYYYETRPDIESPPVL